MKRSQPLTVTMPATGILFAESVHAGDFHMARRTDPFHKLLYVLRGHVSYGEKGRESESVSAGMLVVIPSGVEHEISDQLPSTLFLLCLNPTILGKEPELSAIWNELAGRDARRIALSRPSRHHVESVWRQAMLERIRPRTGSLTTIKALAAQLLVTLVRLPALKLSIDSYARVAAVAREMENSFYDEWNLDRAATRAGISRRHFSALFSKLQGCTFWEHLTDLRLNHAVNLLRKGDHSVTGVVFACGLGMSRSSIGYFENDFASHPSSGPAACGDSNARGLCVNRVSADGINSGLHGSARIKALMTEFGNRSTAPISAVDLLLIAALGLVVSASIRVISGSMPFVPATEQRPAARRTKTVRHRCARVGRFRRNRPARSGDEKIQPRWYWRASASSSARHSSGFPP